MSEAFQKEREAESLIFNFALRGGTERYADLAPVQERYAAARRLFGPVEGRKGAFWFRGCPEALTWRTRREAELAQTAAVRIATLLMYNCTVEYAIEDVVRVALEAMRTI